MGQKKKIMIIDDDKNIRMTLNKTLSKDGYDVFMEKNGEDALERLQEEEIPVVLLDMKLPGKDGIEILKEINELDYATNVIMITGYGNVNSAIETMKLGAVDYLQKPFKPDEIKQLVNKVFNRRELADIDKDLDDVNKIISKAKLMINKRKFDAAIDLLKKATSFDVENPEPFNLLGVIYEVRGKHGKAMKMYRAALALDPAYTPANDNLQRASESSTGDLDKMNTGDKNGKN